MVSKPWALPTETPHGHTLPRHITASPHGSLLIVHGLSFMAHGPQLTVVSESGEQQGVNRLIRAHDQKVTATRLIEQPELPFALGKFFLGSAHLQLTFD